MSDKQCVVIACVTFETAKIVDPAVSFGADEVHLFHYIRDPTSANGKIYSEFYAEVCTQIRQKLPKVRIVEHCSDPVYDFPLMFRDLLNIVDSIREGSRENGDEGIGKDAEILINASAGSSEFSAAAIVTSMMSKNVKSFTVGTREYTIKTEDIQNLYYKGGRPVGLTEHTHSPRIIPNFDIERPDKDLVMALKSYYRRSQAGKALTASAVIQQLKDDGLWNYKPNTSDHKTLPKQKETMYYQRHFVERWVNYGWIERLSEYTKYKLTDNGIIVVNTFYTE